MTDNPTPETRPDGVREALDRIGEALSASERSRYEWVVVTMPNTHARALLDRLAAHEAAGYVQLCGELVRIAGLADHCNRPAGHDGPHRIGHAPPAPSLSPESDVETRLGRQLRDAAEERRYWPDWLKRTRRLNDDGAPMPTDAGFGAALREARVRAGLSLRDAAALLGVSTVRLGEVERGVASFAPGHTDLMVSPESLDEFLAAPQGESDAGPRPRRLDEAETLIRRYGTAECRREGIIKAGNDLRDFVEALVREHDLSTRVAGRALARVRELESALIRNAAKLVRLPGVERPSPEDLIDRRAVVNVAMQMRDAAKPRRAALATVEDAPREEER